MHSGAHGRAAQELAEAAGRRELGRGASDGKRGRGREKTNPPLEAEAARGPVVVFVFFPFFLGGRGVLSFLSWRGGLLPLFGGRGVYTRAMFKPLEVLARGPPDEQVR